MCWRTFTLYALEKKSLNKLIFKQPFQTFVLSSPHPGHFIDFMILCDFFFFLWFYFCKLSRSPALLLWCILHNLLPKTATKRRALTLPLGEWVLEQGAVAAAGDVVGGVKAQGGRDLHLSRATGYTSIGASLLGRHMGVNTLLGSKVPFLWLQCAVSYPKLCSCQHRPCQPPPRCTFLCSYPRGTSLLAVSRDFLLVLVQETNL